MLDELHNIPVRSVVTQTTRHRPALPAEYSRCCGINLIFTGFMAYLSHGVFLFGSCILIYNVPLSGLILLIPPVTFVRLLKQKLHMSSLDLSVRHFQTSAFTLTFRPLYLRRNSLQFHVSKIPSGPQTGCGRTAEKNITLNAGNTVHG